MLDWINFKTNYINNGQPATFYIEYLEYFIIWFDQGLVRCECKLFKNDIVSLTEFEATIKNTSNKKVPINTSIFPYNEGYSVRFRGYNFGTAIAGQKTDLLVRIDADRYCNGMQLLLKNHVLGDVIDLEIIDVDNVLGYGNNIVLDRFSDNWFVDPDAIVQKGTVVSYPGLIKAGLYVRIAYYSVGTVDVLVKANLLLHAKYS